MFFNETEFKEIYATIYETNKKWWHDLVTGKKLERSKETCMMLIITELAEAAEGVRKDRMDDHLPHRTMEETELADAYIRTIDYIQGFGFEYDRDMINRRKKSDTLTRENKMDELYFLCNAVDLYIQGAITCFIVELELYCEAFNLDLWGAMKEKLEYNKTRKDHTKEARLAAGGKKL